MYVFEKTIAASIDVVRRLSFFTGKIPTLERERWTTRISLKQEHLHKFLNGRSLQDRLIEAKEMADLPKPPLGFETESIITLHVIFAFLVSTLNALIEVKLKFTRASPSVTCNWVIVALVIYATASVAEIMLRNRKSTYHLIAGYTRFYASGFAAILLLVILDPILGYIISVLWGGLFAGLTYGSNKELQELLWQTAQLGHDLWTKLVGNLGCNGEEEPDQANRPTL